MRHDTERSIEESADIDGTKNNVAVNVWLPQPCGNVCDTSSSTTRRPKYSISHVCRICARIGEQHHGLIEKERPTRSNAKWYYSIRLVILLVVVIVMAISIIIAISTVLSC